MNERFSTGIDLEPIMVKVMDKEEGLGWSIDYTKRVAAEYEKYLILCKEFPEESLVPSSPIDDFWHFHILDTQKYQEDCQIYFGYFLHHFPYFGMRGKDDEDNLEKAWTDSCLIYESRFGQLPKDIWLASRRCPNCGRRGNSSIYTMDQRPRLSSVMA